MRRLEWLLTILLCLGCAPAVDGPVRSPPQATTDLPSSAATESESPAPSRAYNLRFRDVAADLGVRFAYRNGEEGDAFTILETVGGGVGLLDYDQDDRLDLFFPGGGTLTPEAQVGGLPGALYRQIESHEFRNVAEAAGVDASTHYTHGVTIADVNNDGFPDMLVTGYQGLQFFCNQGDGTFVECSRQSGLTDSLWSSSAAWGDLNGDGCPDLYVAHYVDWSPTKNPRCEHARPGVFDICPPREFESLSHWPYFSAGDGTFRAVDMNHPLATTGKGLSVLLADLDLDLDLDVFISNDSTPNIMLQNEGNGEFRDISAASGTDFDERGMPRGSMGVDSGDYNLDGLPDLWVSNYERESLALYRNLGGGLFRDVSQSTGITAVGARYVSWGTVFFDGDNDGDEDMIVVNGHVMRFPVYSPVRQLPLLFENLGGQRFEEVRDHAGEWMTTPHSARGCAAGDLDRDGDVDLVVSQMNEPCALLINEAPVAHHWVELRLVGTVSSRDAAGALVAIRTPLGRQVRQLKGGGSYLSASEMILHFGLGSADRIEEAEIRWPSGIVQTLADVRVDRRHLIVEPNDASRP